MSFWPTFLRRLVDAEPLPVAQVELWPANPRSYDDDLKQSLSNEAFLAAQLRDARQLLDKTEGTALRRTAERRAERAEADLAVEAARAAAAVLRADEAEAKYGRLAEHCVVAFGYTDADFEEITGQPRKAAK